MAQNSKKSVKKYFQSKTEGHEEKDWTLEKNVCHVFADFISRSKNEGFLNNAMEILKDSNILDPNRVEKALRKFREEKVQS